MTRTPSVSLRNSLRRGALPLIAVALFASVSGIPAEAANYSFDVEYLGGNVAQLAPGSDNPVGTLIQPGDAFQWTIASVDERFWLVNNGGPFFPLMAFPVALSGIRNGDFTLTLRNNGADVFTLLEASDDASEVHLGTNTVVLDAGLAFDEMFLDYALNSAVTPDRLGPVATRITSLLPIFGAPENNTFYPGIVFTNVPEPSAAASLTTAFAAAAVWRGRRRLH